MFYFSFLFFFFIAAALLWFTEKIHLWKFTYIYTDPPLTLMIKRVKRQYPNYFSKLHTSSPCVSSSSACSNLHFPAFLTKIISFKFISKHCLYLHFYFLHKQFLLSRFFCVVWKWWEHSGSCICSVLVGGVDNFIILDSFLIAWIKI